MPSDRPYTVFYAPDVSAQLEAALRWWAEHRDKAPGGREALARTMS